MRLTILALLVTLSFTACREDDIRDTQKQCKEINEHLSSYQRKNIDLGEHGTDAGSVTIYLKDNKMVMAVSTAFSESDRSNAQYYFDGDNLMCVVQQNYTYNQPTYMTEERALKNGDSVWYDDRKTKMTTNRYYFYNGDMVKWFDKDNKEIPETNKKYMLQAALLLRDAEKLKKMNELQK